VSEERNPYIAPAPGDRWRDNESGVVREVFDVRQRGGKGPILVYFWQARQWTGGEIKEPRRVRNAETGKLEVKLVSIGQPTAKVPPRIKRHPIKVWTQWAIGGTKTYLGNPGEITKPGRVTFAMKPAHQAFPEKASVA
jgi:hypothetical protein